MQNASTSPAVTTRWVYEPSTRTIRDVRNHWIATMDSFDGAVDNDANFRLIVAAPELLDECRNLLIGARAALSGEWEPTADCWESMIHQLERVIEKATGSEFR